MTEEVIENKPKKSLKILFLLMIPIVLVTLVFTARITSKLSDYEKNKTEKAELLSAENRLGNVSEWLPWGLGPGDTVMKESEELENEATNAYNSAMRDGAILLLFVVAFMIAINIFYRNSERRNQAIGLSLVIASVCFFYLGINEPFLEMEAYKDDVSVSGNLFDYEIGAGVEGRVYFFYSNKSVLSLIELLYKGGNFFVAIAIIIFSLIFPLIKLVFSFIIFLNPRTEKSKKAVSLINKLGKWSMVDVFVAASWLAYFSFANTEMAIETGSSTLIGLYFFTAFVIFSIVSGIYLKKSVKT
jgi:uncharacterized protein YpmB